MTEELQGITLAGVHTTGFIDENLAFSSLHANLNHNGNGN